MRHVLARTSMMFTTKASELLQRCSSCHISQQHTECMLYRLCNDPLIVFLDCVVCKRLWDIRTPPGRNQLSFTSRRTAGTCTDTDCSGLIYVLFCTAAGSGDIRDVTALSTIAQFEIDVTGVHPAPCHHASSRGYFRSRNSARDIWR